MIAVDSNVLVYAHREDSSWYEHANACLVRLAEGRAPWAIPWPCIHEFLAIVTHPRIYNPPTRWRRRWIKSTHGWNLRALCYWRNQNTTGTKRETF